MEQDEKKGETKSSGKEQKKIKTSTGLIAIFAAVVLFFGGAFTYWTYNDPNSYSTSTDSTVVSTTVKEDPTTVDWSTYTNTDYGFSFKYPKEWESTKVETTSDTSQGEYGTDIVLKVSFYDPANKKLIDCANNEYQNWSDKSPTKTECDPILSALTKAEKDKLVGPRMPKNIYVRVYKDDPSLALKDWLYQKYHKPDTNLSDYQVGKGIEIGGIKGYRSSIGCCASADNNYVIKANGNIISLGTNYFDDNLSDTHMPAIFTQIAGTFKATDLTADWKTYTNSIYGYSFKYPQNYIVEKTKDQDGADNPEAAIVKKTANSDGVIELHDPGITDFTSKSILGQFGGTQDQYMSLESVNITGGKGYKVKFSDNVKDVVSSFYFAQNTSGSLILEITILNNDSVGKQIFDTFQFTK